MPKTPHTGLAFIAMAGAAVLALSGCGAGEDPAAADAPPQATLAIDEEARALLPEQIREDGKLVFGTTANNAPFTMKPAEGIVGMVPDLGKELGAVLGVDVAFEPMSFPGLVPALEADRIDAVWTLMTATEEREQTMEMVSFMKNSTGFMTLADAEPIETVDDLCGRHLATVRGGTIQALLEKVADDCAAEGKERPQTSYYDDAAAAQTQLRSGKIDVFSGITVPLRYVAEQVNGGKTFAVSDVELLGGAQAVALGKGDKELVEAVRAGLRKVVESGRYDEILAEYGAQNEAFTPEQIVANPATSGELDAVVKTQEDE
ncbi:transporter substrate-binding domain-containing protein [Arthrobacter crystallopoietes]|uniref:transporter substrate-binding domain-containing protein n=1 Tax=Crystallibacter crystallopoietes TaxID=37928 RepID=UPI0011111C41|nr:transporter substrate-binding domain-containing protein [Arthrobacter crystallopoietes]